MTVDFNNIRPYTSNVNTWGLKVFNNKTPLSYTLFWTEWQKEFNAVIHRCVHQPVKVRQLLVKETKWCSDKDPSLLLHRWSPASSRVQRAECSCWAGSGQLPLPSVQADALPGVTSRPNTGNSRKAQQLCPHDQGATLSREVAYFLTIYFLPSIKRMDRIE